MRAAEPLPPFGVRLAYPDDEVPAVPHDRLGLFLVEHGDRGVAEGGEHFKVHGRGCPGGVDEVSAQPGDRRDGVAAAVPGEERGDPRV